MMHLKTSIAMLICERWCCRKGIIGEPLVNFNMLTLSPKGAGTEETEEEEAKSDERKG